MSDKKTAIGLSTLFLAVIAIMLALIPIEKKHQYYQKWGKLAVLAETDERAQFAIDNAELYPEYWFNLLYSDSTFELAYNYPFLKDNYQKMSFTDEELAGAPIYMDDTRWIYEDDSIRNQGCVAVAVTMANLYLNHNADVDPVKVVNYAVEMDYYGLGGIGKADISDILAHFGMTAEEHIFEDGNRVTETELKAAADTEGAVLLVALQGETFGNHALIIRGYDENGFFINDPADPEKTAKQWSPEIFENELVRYWIITD
ncbi:MAG: hypothetical protein NC253_07225 [Ruminococcus sp.]|nr:hypothetical protein [Ruminococcus sp.]